MRLCSGEVDRALALVRPPGHHAMAMVHGIRGFCTINIEAVMIQHMRQTYGIKRVAVVDTDVHHGDGSQDVFYHDPDTLYILVSIKMVARYIQALALWMSLVDPKLSVAI